MLKKFKNCLSYNKKRFELNEKGKKYLNELKIKSAIDYVSLLNNSFEFSHLIEYLVSKKIINNNSSDLKRVSNILQKLKKINFVNYVDGKWVRI